MRSITQLVNSENDDAIDELIHIAYERLHKSARIALGQGDSNQSMQATELVNELYLHFKKHKRSKFQDSAHFFAIAALKIQQILTDRYRRNSAQKRNKAARVPLEEAGDIGTEPPLIETLVVNKYIDVLQEIDPIAARTVELLSFWEFTTLEAAEILNVSDRTINRKWKWAKAWLASIKAESRHV